MAYIAREASRKVPGSSPILLMAVASRESSMDPDAINPRSGTGGLFQFSDSTWIEAVRLHGAKHGHAAMSRTIHVKGGITVVEPAARRRIIAMRSVPLFSALMAAEMLSDSRVDAEAALGRPALGVDLYVIHAKGLKGGVTFLHSVASGHNAQSYGVFVADITRREKQAIQALGSLSTGSGKAATEVAMAP